MFQFSELNGKLRLTHCKQVNYPVIAIYVCRYVDINGWPPPNLISFGSSTQGAWSRLEWDKRRFLYLQGHINTTPGRKNPL